MRKPKISDISKPKPMRQMQIHKSEKKMNMIEEGDFDE